MRRFLLCAVVVVFLSLFGCSSNDDLEGRIVALEAAPNETPSLTDEGPTGTDGVQGPQGEMGPQGETGKQSSICSATLLWNLPECQTVTVPIGGKPVAMVFDGSHIWVANYYSDESLAKIDPTDGRVLDVFPIGNRLNALAFDGQSIWVANRKDSTVMKVDSTSGQLLEEIYLGKDPAAIAFDGENIWVAVFNGGPTSSDSLIKINPSTNQIVATVKVGESPSGMVFDGSSMWIANAADNTVMKLDTSRDVITAVVYVGEDPSHLTFDGTSIWVTNYGDDTISKINPTTNEVIDIIQVGNGPTEITFDGTSIWVVYFEDKTVSRINPETNKVIAMAYQNDFTNAIIFDGNNIWVSNGFENGTVVKLVPSAIHRRNSGPNTEEPAIELGAKTDCSETLVSECVTATVNVGSRPTDMAFDGTNIWVVDSSDATVTKVNLDTNEIFLAIQLEGSPSNVIFDGANIWVGGSILHKINPSLNVVDIIETEAANLVFDGKHIWGITSAQELVKINPVNGSVLSTIDVGLDLHSIVTDGNNLWVSNPFNDTISRIDIANNAVADTFPIKIDEPVKVFDAVWSEVFEYPDSEIGRPWEMEFDGRYLWVTHLNDSSVSKIDITNNQVLANIAVGDQPEDILFDGSHIWVVNCDCIAVGEPTPSNILKIDPSIDRVVAMVTVGISPKGLVSDGNHIWVSNGYDGNISKVVP